MNKKLIIALKKVVKGLTEQETVKFIKEHNEKPTQEDLQKFVDAKGLNEEGIKEIMYDLNKHNIFLKKPSPAKIEIPWNSFWGLFQLLYYHTLMVQWIQDDLTQGDSQFSESILHEAYKLYGTKDWETAEKQAQAAHKKLIKFFNDALTEWKKKFNITFNHEKLIADALIIAISSKVKGKILKEILAKIDTWAINIQPIILGSSPGQSPLEIHTPIPPDELAEYSN